jgi:signal transduction histidine kinase
VGISHETLENLFKPFQTTKEAGLGLGLTYCKQTVDEHKGTIDVTSEVGEGTTFTITLPLGRASEKGIEEFSVNPSPILQRQDTCSRSPR